MIRTLVIAGPHYFFWLFICLEYDKNKINISINVFSLWIATLAYDHSSGNFRALPWQFVLLTTFTTALGWYLIDKRHLIKVDRGSFMVYEDTIHNNWRLAHLRIVKVIATCHWRYLSIFQCHACLLLCLGMLINQLFILVLRAFLRLHFRICKIRSFLCALHIASEETSDCQHPEIGFFQLPWLSGLPTLAHPPILKVH